MNIIKLITPDYFIGKTLVTIKSLVDIIVMLIRERSRQSLKLAKLILQVKPTFTMVTNSNLINLYNIIIQVNALDIPGDIVECGVWNGGSAAMMAVACRDDKNNSKERRMWLFDSFQGLPQPGEKDGKMEKDHYFEGLNKGDVQNVERIFSKLDLSLNNLKIIPGWFDSTLHKAEVEQIAVLHIDADWYDSVKLVLNTFYDKVVPGGMIVIDDYGYWTGCDRAVNEFLMERSLTNIQIKRTGRVGAYFQKTF